MIRQHGAAKHRTWLLWAMIALTVGCAHREATLAPAPSGRDQSHWLTHKLPVVERGEIEPDLSLLATLNALPAGDVPAPIYHELTDVEAQCLAARNSAVGNLLATERRTARVIGGCACGGAQRAETLRLHLLSFAEVEARNDSAFAALELYFRLALAEHQVDAVRQSLEQIETTRGQVSGLVTSGVRPQADEGSFDREALTLQQQRVDAKIGRAQANEALRALVGVGTGEPSWRIWPVTPLTVDPAPRDVEGAVLTALNERPELGMLRLIEQELDRETLPVARHALSRADALLGFTAPPGCCAVLNSLRCYIEKLRDDPCEIEMRRRQINQYRARREAEIAAEVRHHAETIELRLKQVLYARDRLRHCEQHVEQLQAQRNHGEATFLDVSTAQLEVTKAQTDLTSRVVDWHLAVVRFRHAQGTLAIECGYRATCRCWIVPSE